MAAEEEDFDLMNALDPPDEYEGEIEAVDEPTLAEIREHQEKRLVKLGKTIHYEKYKAMLEAA